MNGGNPRSRISRYLETEGEILKIARETLAACLLLRQGAKSTQQHSSVRRIRGYLVYAAKAQSGWAATVQSRNDYVRFGTSVGVQSVRRVSRP